jgi:hypothetical protein
MNMGEFARVADERITLSGPVAPPVRLLPELLLEVLWKVIWLAAVGLPHLVAGTMTAQLSRSSPTCHSSWSSSP